MAKILDFTGVDGNMPAEFKKARKKPQKPRKEVKESWKKKQS